MTTPVRSVSAAVAAVLLAGCGLPSAAADVALGRDVARSIENEAGRYEERGLQDYLAAVGRRVERQLADSEFTYSYAVLDQPEPNAFAAPGGFVYVTRGLLLLTQSEDELACLLGHAITHVEQRHTSDQLARQQLPDLLNLPGEVTGRVVSRDLDEILDAPVSGLGALATVRYDGDQEAAADREGQRLAAAAGYDPSALPRLLQRVAPYAELLAGAFRRPTFFTTHPAAQDRVREAELQAAQLTRAERAPEALDDAAFLQQLDGLVYGDNPARGEFRGPLFVHPDLDVAITFPAGWDALNTTRMTGAVRPDREAFVFYGGTITGGPARADALARERRDQLREQARLLPSRDTTVGIGGRSARLLTYTDRSGGEAVHLFFVWIASERGVSRFLGVGPESERETVRAVLDSLRPLTPTERRSFDVERVRVVAAQANETFATLNHRVRGVLDPEQLAAMNGLPIEARLGQGQPVKVVVREPYR